MILDIASTANRVREISRSVPVVYSSYFIVQLHPRKVVCVRIEPAVNHVYYYTAANAITYLCTNVHGLKTLC